MITARGAWVCVERHFMEMGKDIAKEDFTVAGIGDMSGDVFGNGMLLSPHIRLVAAFNHRNIFIDPAPDAAKLEEMAASALYTAELTRDLRGSDFVHWGEGTVSVSATEVTHQGKLAPGPDYKLYLTQGLVDHEDTFDRAKAVQIGDVKSFSGFIVTVPDGVDVEAYDSILVWCEAFGEFITAASYK